MKRLPVLVWDKWNKEHVKKHKVTVGEVEEAYQNEFARALTYNKRIIVHGKTKKGRLITIILSFAKQKDPYVATARDMSRKERRLYL